jgi:hypothetical protein
VTVGHWECFDEGQAHTGFDCRPPLPSSALRQEAVARVRWFGSRTRLFDANLRFVGTLSSRIGLSVDLAREGDVLLALLSGLTLYAFGQS